MNFLEEMFTEDILEDIVLYRDKYQNYNERLSIIYNFLKSILEDDKRYDDICYKE